MADEVRSAASAILELSKVALVKLALTVYAAQLVTRVGAAAIYKVFWISVVATHYWSNSLVLDPPVGTQSAYPKSTALKEKKSGDSTPLSDPLAKEPF